MRRCARRSPLGLLVAGGPVEVGEAAVEYRRGWPAVRRGRPPPNDAIVDKFFTLLDSEVDGAVDAVLGPA